MQDCEQAIAYFTIKKGKQRKKQSGKMAAKERLKAMGQIQTMNSATENLGHCSTNCRVITVLDEE